ncbi:MAG: LytR/AlgR family response regulator transcription factor [Oscillospiraceae bacterium]
MVPIFICDDEPAVLQALADTIQKQLFILNYDMGPVLTAQSREEFWGLYQPAKTPAIYFLDVDLQTQANGFALAAEIRGHDPLGSIVFVTGHADLAFETFRYRLAALDYIVKGSRQQVDARIAQCLETIHAGLLAAGARVVSYYPVKIFDTIRHIPINEILFFEADGPSHRIILHTQHEAIGFFGSLNAIEAELEAGFFRAHRSFLVNRGKIESIQLAAQAVRLCTGQVCPLSRSAKKALRETSPP